MGGRLAEMSQSLLEEFLFTSGEKHISYIYILYYWLEYINTGSKTLRLWHMMFPSV